MIAAWYGSRGLAYLSTAYYVFRLNFWVRNETRCVPKAMAAITTMLLLDALVLNEEHVTLLPKSKITCVTFSSQKCFALLRKPRSRFELECS